MKRASRKVTILCAALASTAALTWSPAFAADPGVEAAVKAFHTALMNYLMSPSANDSIEASKKLNTNENQAKTNAKTNADNYTQSMLTSNLMQFPADVVNVNPFNDKALMANINYQNNIINMLTTGLPGSDTLFLNSSGDSAATAKVAKPSQTFDNYFNIDSILSPSAYNSDQQKAANYYLQFLTQQYTPITEGINLSQLKSNLNTLKEDDRANALSDFIHSDAYRNYQLNARSAIANKSIAISNINQLIAERTPQKNLGRDAGLPGGGDASPLQVENYIADQRFSNKDWYNKLESESPSAVNREQTLILAEINKKLQQNHLDNERLLTTMTALLIQMSQSNQAGMRAAAQDVNTEIDNVGQQNKSGSNDNDNNDDGSDNGSNSGNSSNGANNK